MPHCALNSVPPSLAALRSGSRRHCLHMCSGLRRPLAREHQRWRLSPRTPALAVQRAVCSGFASAVSQPAGGRRWNQRRMPIRVTNREQIAALAIDAAVSPHAPNGLCASPPPAHSTRSGRRYCTGNPRIFCRAEAHAYRGPAVQPNGSLRPSPRSPAAALQRALRSGFVSAVPQRAGGPARL
jgi:hypothetical protein